MGDWDVTVRVVITVVLVVITVLGGTLVVTVREGVCCSAWILVGWISCTGWTDSTTPITSGVHRPQSGSRDPGAGEVNPPLAATTLDRGSHNLTGADEARKFGVC